MSTVPVRALRSVLRQTVARAGPSTRLTPRRVQPQSINTKPSLSQYRQSPNTSTRFDEAEQPGFASSTSSPPSSTDPTLDQANDLIDKGTKELEEGNLEGAKKAYMESIEMKATSGAWFNLGVCEYHMKNNTKAIEAWEKSISIQPSADAYTNMASAYVMGQPPQPGLAIKHLTSALEFAPNDPEIAFNLAAVLESTDNLETALKMYERAKKGGIDRAAQNIRNVGAKILAKAQKGTSGGDGKA